VNREQYLKFVLALICAICTASCCNPEFVSIAPNELEQGNLNIQIELEAECTFFEEGNILILFNPPEGITMHDVIVEDPTTLSFLIDVAKDTPVGFKNVVVTYDVGDHVYTISGVSLLEVLPAT
jgi:hypothetical protein